MENECKRVSYIHFQSKIFFTIKPGFKMDIGLFYFHVTIFSQETWKKKCEKKVKFYFLCYLVLALDYSTPFISFRGSFFDYLFHLTAFVVNKYALVIVTVFFLFCFVLFFCFFFDDAVWNFNSKKSATYRHCSIS